MTDSDNIVIARNLQKSFGKGEAATHVLRGLDLSVRRGEFLAIMGPSGCGKSTLLHVLGLMTPADEGELFLDGENTLVADAAAIRRTRIGFVFQRFNLLGVLSARENVETSLRVRGIGVNGQVARLFEQLGVAHLAGRKPSAMSIGEQQRVAVARAVAHRPALLLADEPTGNLDSANAASLLGVFQQMNRELGQTVIMITHSPEAAGFASRVVHMKDGRLVE